MILSLIWIQVFSKKYLQVILFFSKCRWIQWRHPRYNCHYFITLAWFNASCRRAYDAQLAAYGHGVQHAILIIGVNLCSLVQRLRGSMVLQGYNERTSNPLKHSTSSHKWWKTLKRLNFWCESHNFCSQGTSIWFGRDSYWENSTFWVWQ